MTSDNILNSELFNTVNSYLSKDKVTQIYQAYLLAKDAHKGQYRKSGEAYVFHPLAVALILAKIKLDYQSIIAAILHDVIEDTSVSKKDIKKTFGRDIAHIVEGVSKIEHLEHQNISIKQAQNFRKLLLAASTDIRVLIIKLADRLHNMRTINHMSKYDKLRIATETESIYTPIARRLGLATITKELKYICFQIIYPFRYKVLNKKITQKFKKNSKILAKTTKHLSAKLNQVGIDYEIISRKKNVVSIYNKMKIKNLKFNEIFDLYALRIIVKDINVCYQVLGIVHNIYKPVPGKFKDYIALPKNNGYQSLHTIVFAQNKQLVEIQIRSVEMNNVAKYGIASHWYYKDNKRSSTLLKNISFKTHDEDFIESAKAEFYPNDVFVFTPAGEIITLPYKSTALDFAYNVHTSIGNYAHSTIIDNIKRPLSTEIKSGQTIEIITQKKPAVNIERINIVTTIKAKYEIKSFLRKHFKKQLILQGKQLLASTLYYQNIDLNCINLNNYLNEFNVNNVNKLFSKIALKEILLSKIVNLINAGDHPNISDNDVNKNQNITPELASCCYPLPGDKVVGIIQQTKGLVVHRKNCNFVIKNKNIYKVDWDFITDKTLKTRISCNITNERGALASIATTISNNEINIIDIEVKELNNETFFELIIEVKSMDHLNYIISQVNKLELVHNAKRV